MKILTPKLLFYVLVFIAVNATKNFAQTANVTISQDSKFESLLIEKRKLNSSIATNDRFKIQIFNGDAETAKNALSDFKKNNKSMDGTIVFVTPIYKVVVGAFKTRIEAEKNLIEFKKKYPLAFLIKPSKN